MIEMLDTNGMMVQFMEELDDQLRSLREGAYKTIENMFNRHAETLPDSIDKELLAVILRIQFDTYDQAVERFHEALGRTLFGDDVVDDMIREHLNLEDPDEDDEEFPDEEDDEDDLEPDSDRAKITLFIPPQHHGDADGGE